MNMYLKNIYPNDRKIFISILIGLILIAWVSLIYFGQFHYGRFHDSLSHMSPDGDDNNDNFINMIIIFIVSWTLMTVAMMLPSTLPLIFMFRSMVWKKRNGTLLVSLLIIGYLNIWSVFGIIVYLLNNSLHYIIRQNTIFDNGWLIGAIILMIAGLYQFSNLKYYCLDKCRSPKSFIIQNWQGRNEKFQSFRLGINHGIFCVGCCWSIMVLMFLVGFSSLIWMLMLSIIMSIEKNLPRGRFFSNILGIFLIGWSLTIFIRLLY